MTWLSLALVWGTVRVFVVRVTGGIAGFYDSIYDPTSILAVNEQENQWGFGQVVAVGILLLPSISFTGEKNGSGIIIKLMNFTETYFSPPATILQVPIGHDNPLVVQGAPLIQPPAVSDMRQELLDSDWYPRLITLWYLLTIAVLADVLYAFPGSSDKSTLDLTQTRSFGSLLVQYAVWIALDVGILWVPTIMFLDRDLRAFWKRLRIRTIFSSKLVSNIAWVCIIMVLLMVSIVFDLGEYYYLPLQDIGKVGELIGPSVI